MAFTLSEMISGALRKMGNLRISWTTSSGTSTTAIDASLVGQTSDDDYKYAPWFAMSTGSAGASGGVAAGEMGEVSSYSGGTGLFAFATGTLSTTVDITTPYGIGTPEFRLKLLIELANDALRSLGDLDNVDTATIGTSAGVDEYDLPVAMKRSAPLRVDLQTYTTSSGSVNDWVTIHDWEYQPAAAGSVGTLVLPPDLASGRDLRVWYVAPHGRVAAFNATIDERVHPDLAVLALVEKLYEYRNSMNRGSMAFDVQRWNDAKTQVQEAKVFHPIWKSRRKPKLMIVGDAEEDYSTLPFGPV